MQSPSSDHPSIEPVRHLQVVSGVPDPTDLVTEEASQIVTEPTQFRSQFIDHMELYADARRVAEYFDAHHTWFRRCAQPMTVEAIGENAYALVIGQFGSFGYEVEPKIGLNLLPQDAGVYRIETVPIPNYEATGYDVDFRAAMELVESGLDDALRRELAHSSGAAIEKLTRIQWQLDLTVTLQFPRFIQALPKSLVQSTGDRLLRQVVRQVSNRLTRKVQEDFCATYDVPLPKRHRKWFFHKAEDGDQWHD